MSGYIVRRLVLAIPTILLVSVLAFGMVRIIPGDILDLRLSDDVSGSGKGIEELRRQLGLDQPAHVQYLTYLSGLVRGDLGKSLWNDRPVLQEILVRVPAQ